jgi:hypothetical protein
MRSSSPKSGPRADVSTPMRMSAKFRWWTSRAVPLTTSDSTKSKPQRVNEGHRGKSRDIVRVPLKTSD